MPPGVAALAWGEGGTTSVATAGRELRADGVGKLFFFKTEPRTLDYEFDSLTSRDGFEASAKVAIHVQLVPDRVELNAFCQAVLAGATGVTVERLREHCREAVRTATARFVKSRDAFDLVTVDAAGAFDSVIAEAFRPLGFESGLALGKDSRITIQSSDYARTRQNERVRAQRSQLADETRQARELAAEARHSHLDSLAATLQKLREVSSTTGGVAAKELIKTFSTAERGALYHALVAECGQARRTDAIVLAAGEELLWFDPRAPQSPQRRLTLDTPIGPLRSVRLAQRGSQSLLLVGGRSGVHLLAEEQDPRQSFAFQADRELRGGVNAAAVVGESLFATHSEVGLIRWSLRKSSDFEFVLPDLFAGAKSIRDVQPDEDGAIWLAADRRVLRLTMETGASPLVLTAPAVVSSLLVAGGSVFAGLEDGRIVRWLAAQPDLVETLRPAGGRAAESIAWVEGGGVPRLLLADGRQHLDLQVLGDAYRAEYRCEQCLRWGFAAADWVVGVNDRRDQVVLWRIDTPEEPFATIHVRKLCGRSIQDLAMVPVQPLGANG